VEPTRRGVYRLAPILLIDVFSDSPGFVPGFVLKGLAEQCVRCPLRLSRRFSPMHSVMRPPPSSKYVPYIAFAVTVPLCGIA
jgi:hypothetical protein